MYRLDVWMLKFLLGRHKHVSTICSNEQRDYRYDVYWVYFLPSKEELEALEGRDKEAKRLYILDDGEVLDEETGGSSDDISDSSTYLYVRKLKEREEDEKNEPFEMDRNFYESRKIELVHHFRRYKRVHSSVASAFVWRVFLLDWMYVFWRWLAQLVFGYYVKPVGERLRVLEAMLALRDTGNRVVWSGTLVAALHGRGADYVGSPRFLSLLRRYDDILKSLKEERLVNGDANVGYRLHGEWFRLLNELRREKRGYKIQVYIAFFTGIMAVQAFWQILMDYGLCD